MPRSPFPIPLTRKQLDCARVIAELTTIGGKAPAFAEVAHELDCAVPEVYRLADQLEERGWLARRGRCRHQTLVLQCEPPPVPMAEFAIELTERAVDALRIAEARA